MSEELPHFPPPEERQYPLRMWNGASDEELTFHVRIHHARMSVHPVIWDLRQWREPAWVLSYVERGHLTLRAREWTQTVTEGTLMVHPPYIPYDEYSTVPCEHWYVVFDAHWEQAIPRDFFLRFPVSLTVPLGERREEYRRVFQQLHEHTEGSNPQPWRAAIHLLRLIDIAIEAWEAEGAPPRPKGLHLPSGRFIELVSYMESHLSDELTMAELAERVGLHPHSFSQSFRRFYGRTPGQFLRDLRLRRAQALLLSTEAPLDSIAIDCGFADAVHLSHLFKKQFGFSPGKWRKSVFQTRNSS
ncbi:MAG: AraC family transcriptional regulator [Armatimonas sp.]